MGNKSVDEEALVPTDTRIVRAKRQDYKPNDIVVFVGNSADVMGDAQRIQALEGELQLECFTKSEDERLHPFRLKIYHWKEDLGTHRAQEEINRHIDQADAAVFVFKIESGEVTRAEVERCRKRGIEIFACFPTFQFAKDCCRGDRDFQIYLDTRAYKTSLGSGEGWAIEGT